MKVDTVHIQNFRGFAEASFRLHPQFNVIVGNNGTGKTALLESLNIAIGSFFLGIRHAKTRHVRTEDIRVQRMEHGEEEQYPVSIQTSGWINGQAVNWKRSKTRRDGRTLQRNASRIKRLAQEMEQQVRDGAPVSLPLLAYYSTGRLWKERKSRSRSQNHTPASRFRGYYNCLEATSNFSDFLSWFKGKELAFIQRREPSPALDTVKQTVVNNLPGCRNIYFEFDPDQPQGLKAELEDGRILPFRYLSDGTRNLLALMADLAYRCVLLNPQLGTSAPSETEGIVLIDELDLHLHPDWQKKVINGLKNSFPKLQFICTTHSPYLIQETEYGELIQLQEDQYQYLQAGGGTEKSLEDIAEEIQGVENPQWSRKRQAMYEAAKEYYQVLEEQPQNEGEVHAKKARLDELTKPFADNVAYVAFLEQKRRRNENS